MNNTKTETTVEGALRAYMLTKHVSDMSKDPRQLEEILTAEKVSYISETLIVRDGEPKVRVLKFTNRSGWKRTVLATMEGPGIEGAWYDNYDYFSGDVDLSRAEWLETEEKLQRKYA